MDVRPWSDSEKRYVLAEAIKCSQVPFDSLFNFVKSQFPVTAWPWEDMLLPNGRTLKQCKEAFENPRLGSSVPDFQHQVQSQVQSLSPSLPVPTSSATSSGAKRKSNYDSYSPGHPLKRRQSIADPITTARDIRPKPSNTGSPLSQPTFSTPEPKKRGRPSKKDAERKQQEMIARGDILPPVSSVLGYQPSGEDGSIPGYAPIRPALTPALHYAPYKPIPEAPIHKDIPDSAGSSGKRRRPKALPKSSKTAAKQPGESSFNANPTIDSKLESEETQTITSGATPESVPVASLIEAAKIVPSNFPVTATATELQTATPLPSEQAPDA
ncbi:uncharacterized protein RAG0_13321 [Rhynchosporium agropyri]|uniref:Myb-like domain-containing protein n=1 Tax=Rhynchosporium agropyri TaxID=914238 RepID=A0A1E1LC89_9HELO|nr:uncharacterized protein RAG0_13321 [Rhynchosporium agropyri]